MQPDFGEFQEEMNALRAQRAAKFQKHQESLRRKHLERKAAEDAERQRELQVGVGWNGVV